MIYSTINARVETIQFGIRFNNLGESVSMKGQIVKVTISNVM